MVATDYRTLAKHEEGSNDVSYLAGEALLDLTSETHDQKKIACTSLNDVSLLTTDAADATISGDKSEQHSDADLDREIDRALAEIRQDASLTEEESETSAGSSTEGSLSNAFDKNPTNSAVDTDNSVNEAGGCEKTDTGEMSKEVTIMDALGYLEKQKKLIRVMFTPSRESMNLENTSFLVPASLVARREQEMLAMASSNGIDESVWSGSLLGRKCLALVGDIALKPAEDDDDYFSCASNDENGGEDAISTEENTYTFVLDDPSSSGTDLAWTPSLVDAIRSYYTLGSVSVPDDCDGRDILLVLDHFAVVYRTEQLVHQSFAVHLRVKLWSEYFDARGQLAEWVIKTILNGRSKLSYFFVTSPDADDGPIFVGTRITTVFDGGLAGDGENISATIVHDLFVDESSLPGDTTDTTDRIDTLIRRDFCTYLLERLPGCSISFDLCTVNVGGPHFESGANGNTLTSIRAVLHLDFSGKSIKKETRKASMEMLGEAAACQTAIRTLHDGGDEENEDQIHPNLAAAPTVVDLDEEETLDVHLCQVNSSDDCDNKSTVSTLSSTGDSGSLLATIVEEDEATRQSAPLPPPLLESANVNINAPVLDHPTSEKYEGLQVAQDPPSRKAEVDCMTIEDLNSQWLLDFINPFATFVEETLQACHSNSISNVESVLLPSLFSIPQLSSRSVSLHSDNESLPTPVRDASVDSVCPPVKIEARLHSNVEEMKLPREAGIEVRPLKSRSADARPPISNTCNAATPLARNGFSSAPTAISAVDIDGRADSKQAKSIGDSTDKMRRVKSIKTVFYRKKSKK